MSYIRNARCKFVYRISYPVGGTGTCFTYRGTLKDAKEYARAEIEYGAQEVTITQHVNTYPRINITDSLPTGKSWTIRR